MGLSDTVRNTLNIVAEQKWLDPVADTLQQAVEDIYAESGQTGRRIKNALHGTWLGHPLHPVLTDVATGAWTMAFVFDALEAVSRQKTFRLAADISVVVGVLGAVGAMASGLTDWLHVGGRARRVGLVHGLLNATATSLYAESMILRLRGERAKGFGAAKLGMVTATAAAYLGGDLVYKEGVGIDRSDHPRLSGEFVSVLAEADLPEGEPKRVEADGVEVVLVKRGSRIFALGEACSHKRGPLSEGKLEFDSIVCPWHGSRFALDDGRVLNGPTPFPQPCFETRVWDGQIEVRAAGR
jgi:nitrite reductase/ring-hydroxylating ferredoxin subunit/uncharacterized membrane protein